MDSRYIITFYLSLISIFSFSQRVITGTVIDTDSSPLIGANILIDGSQTGTITDFNGWFSIEVPAEASSLVVSYTGYQSKKINIEGKEDVIVVLESGILLEETIITALGISREKKSLGYAAQELKGEDLTLTRGTNIISSLSGRISGVQVLSASSASPGGSAKIRIRGSNGLAGGSPLFVVDGTPISNANFSYGGYGTDLGNISQDINPDDIESVSVLKGPSATALYGNRAANGVIMVTTKKGRKNTRIEVSVNSSVMFDRVYVLPEYQNEYAGGYDGTFQKYVDPADGKEYNILEYYSDESWGPKIDGTTMYRPWWSWYPGDDYGKEIPLTAQPNNVRDFYETGIKFNNNISVSGGNENSSIRVSYSNVDHKGIIPNSNVIDHKLSLNSALDITDRLTISSSINFVSNSGYGRPRFGWSSLNPSGNFNQWFQRQLDMEKLRDYKNPDGTPKTWNIRGPDNLRSLFWDSPFFNIYENYATDDRDRYFGNVTVEYEIGDHFIFESSFRRDRYNQRHDFRVAEGGRYTPTYEKRVADGKEDNMEFMLKYNNQVNDFSLDAFIGGGIRKNDFYSDYGRTVGGLSALNLFSLEASVDRPVQRSDISRKEVESFYGSLNVGYKNFLYVGGTLRNDWSSALPVDNNSYLYPSLSASFVFSELANSNWLSYGKLRAAFAEVGADTRPYQTTPSYNIERPFGNLARFHVPSQLYNAELRPALSSSYEFGLEMMFYRRKFGFDITYYREDNKDQILSLQVPGSSGYESAVINAGNIRDEGWELSLNASPVSRQNFKWEMMLNIARNESKVIELAEGLDNKPLEQFGSYSLNAPVGGEWATQRGTAFKRIDGIKVINEDGSYATERDKDLGGMLPDYTGGFFSNLIVHGVELSAFFDFQIGGIFWSQTKTYNNYSGLSPETAGLNDKGIPVRDPVDQGGGIKVSGVLENGEPYEVYVDPETHFKSLINIDEAWNYEATYVKLRELRLGYNLPQRWLKSDFIKGLNISLIAQNVWLIHTEVDGLDPSEIAPGSDPFVSGEGGMHPSVRSLGINVKVNF